MPAAFPPRSSKRLRFAVAAVLIATFAYSVVIAGQILLWFVLVGIAAGIYLAWLLVVAVFRLVDAVERIAAALEAGAETPTRGTDAANHTDTTDDPYATDGTGRGRDAGEANG
ncbi:hypothetical protein [Halobellus sp. GM3]|uniref:hypothetical protein n=1 Tax=Halobellus sp. GM3 TaxID=3458410 RepID=UPI00403DFC0D